MRRYTLAELEACPTLSVSQADDLKIETETMRVWLSRCDVASGEPYNNKVTIESFNIEEGKWETVEEYEAK